MNLPGDQIGQIHSAILTAFTKDGFRRIVRVEMNLIFSNIASGDNFEDQVFNFIEWAEQQNRIADLVSAIYKGNPNNPLLQNLAKDFPEWLKNARDKELAEARKLVSDHMLVWKDSNQSGRGDAIILHPNFKSVNTHRAAFADEGKEVKAFLLRCAVQNGMSGQWGKWLLHNTDNELILTPLIRTFSTVAGQRPAWRSAAILEQLPANCIEYEFAQLDTALVRQISYSGYPVAFYVKMLTAQGVVDFLEQLATDKTASDKARDGARQVLDEIMTFGPELRVFHQEQTIYANH